jgi:hypothetical protein
MTLFLVVASCGMVEAYRRFKGACCLHHEGDSPWWLRQQGPLTVHKTTQHNIPEGRRLQARRHENPESNHVNFSLILLYFSACSVPLLSSFFPFFLFSDNLFSCYPVTVRDVSSVMVYFICLCGIFLCHAYEDVTYFVLARLGCKSYYYNRVCACVCVCEEGACSKA